MTGQRIDIERAAGDPIHGHHLFPQKWVRDHRPDLLEETNTIVNIAPITGYTNGWISGQAPECYLQTIQHHGVSSRRLTEILGEHLVRIDLLHSARWPEFREDRLSAIAELLTHTFSGEF